MVYVDQGQQEQLSVATADKLKTISCYRLRLEHDRDARSPCISSRPWHVAAFLWTELFHNLTQEAIAAVFLDNHGVTGWIEPFWGAVDRVAVTPCTILTAALLHGARQLLVAHNHPWGDPTPSPEDLFFTRRLHDACDIVGLRFVDSLVLAHGTHRTPTDFRWVSLRQHAVTQPEAA